MFENIDQEYEAYVLAGEVRYLRSFWDYVHMGLEPAVDDETILVLIKGFLDHE